MPGYARKEIVREGEVGIYHCVSRCVRRAFLCGQDPVSGNDYEHRKEWLQSRLEELAGIFGIEVCCYAILSNHLHVVLERGSRHPEFYHTVMEELHGWLSRQFEDRLVEPNSSLGGAIAYMLKHGEKLTLFLHVPGAPLDNNICERALKKAIRHRRNSLFYKPARGARVGDLFMSLIHTCEFSGATRWTISPSWSVTPETWRRIRGPGCPGATEIHSIASRRPPPPLAELLLPSHCPRTLAKKFLQACRKDPVDR